MTLELMHKPQTSILHKRGPWIAADPMHRVPSEQAFWTCNGFIAYNLHDLLDSLRKMDNASFKYHVNQNKNDFSNWIDGVVGDKKLAKQLLRVKTQKTTILKVEARIRTLKKEGVMMREAY